MSLNVVCLNSLQYDLYTAAFCESLIFKIYLQNRLFKTLISGTAY